jgi:hypothetical protein
MSIFNRSLGKPDHLSLSHNLLLSSETAMTQPSHERHGLLYECSWPTL